ncbi:Sensor protein PfeS [Pigmentiphaga humi]|uniref:histidine kinase n=1 Tax=Pigmentiphaga humi TaxID=2478468 RepID=A0A3P4B3T3_9BURK|nr:HAMP domain-containing sensor histidine kinase [Pigmentiphaga humi]VCU69805.1 Sensor protein PfeS [Pigmentiphaga humi]
MALRQPFQRRIVIAFTLMTLVVSGLFSLGIVGIVQLVEAELISREMQSELRGVVEQLPHLPDLDHDVSFYASVPPGPPIPPQFDRKAGFSEVLSGSGAYYVYARHESSGARYVLVQEQHEFEAREQALFDIVLAGFLLSVAGAWLLGWIVARRIMAPVAQLAADVAHGDQLRPDAPVLAPRYADDEIGRLAAAFDDSFGQLRQLLERERLFTSDVSHELRTPLMIIASSCELLETRPLDQRERQQVDRIHRAAQDMRDLVQTFLELTRPRSQATVQGAQRTLADVAREQAAHWAPQMADRKLVFAVRTEADDTGLYNGTLLASVMSNLLRNALHYTGQGQVSLVLRRGGFDVQDSGTGIPDSQKAAVFAPFVRGEPSRGEGLGLGLSLVKRICARQGWDIALEDAAPHGSLFRVRLDAGPRP